ncbi:MAG: Clp protease N-terminal domain-containing protein, partial [Acidimicrobiales bacterium]
ISAALGVSKQAAHKRFSIGVDTLEPVFGRFNDQAHRVLALAQDEARSLEHCFIGTEHLLLGMLHEDVGIGTQALTALGISAEVVRAKVVALIGMLGSPATGSLPVTPRARKVLDLSLREATQLDHSYVGSEHILLGLVREGEGVAAQILRELGTDLHRARAEVTTLLSPRQDESLSPE